jgi:uncharacterized NAD(P)/FAD-binding protein YdhS
VIQIGQEDEGEGSLPTVAIVGGGVSGTMVAIQLLRTARGPLRVKVIEPREQLGRGIAYSSPSPAHFLNVPASNMSALPDEPRHFLSWMRQCRDPGTSGYSFVSRATYGEYVEQLLREAELGGDSDRSVVHIRDRVVSITPIENGFDVWLEKVPPLRAANPFSAPVETEIVNAWSTTALDQLSRDAPVLLAGSGLTAIDICLSLIEIDQAGPVYIVSRHGLLPRVHLEAPATARPTASKPKSALTVRELFNEARGLVAREVAAGGSWHSIADSLRPHINEIWRGLSQDEKRRFLRHLRPYWEVHRHWMPVQVHHKIEAMRSSGQLRVICGRLADASTGPSRKISVRILTGHSGRHTTIHVAKVINCTGAQNDPRNPTTL